VTTKTTTSGGHTSTTKTKTVGGVSTSSTSEGTTPSSGAGGVIEEEDEDEEEDDTTHGTPSKESGSTTKKERSHEAIQDYGCTSEQSSYWSAVWGGEDNVNIESKTGFRSKTDDKDFWISTKCYEGKKHFKFKEFILKKAIDTCTMKVVTGVQIEYKQNDEWIKLNNGQIIKTGQLEEDDVEMERKITFGTPFIATEVKVVIPKSEVGEGCDGTKNAQGRIEWLIEGPVHAPKKVVVTAEDDDDTEGETTEDETSGKKTTPAKNATKPEGTTPGGNKTTTTGGNTTTTTTSSGGDTTTTTGGLTRPAGKWVRTILDLGGSTYQSSTWSKTSTGNENVNLTSTGGFHNSKEKSEEDFCFTFDFPEYQFYEVNQLILKKTCDEESK